MMLLVWVILDIGSGFICYSIARRKNVNRNIWLLRGLTFGPFAIPFLLAKEAKQPEMFRTPAEAYAKYLKEENDYRRFHWKNMVVGVRVFGALLILFTITGVAFQYSQTGYFVNFDNIHSADIGWELLKIFGAVLGLVIGVLTFVADAKFPE